MLAWIVPSHLSALLLLIACFGRPEQPNLLLVSLDTMRADRLGRLGREGHSLTPKLDALAAEGQRFRSAWAQSNETLFSHGSLFTGRYPSELGPLDYLSWRLSPSTPTLPGALRQAGYRAEAVVAGGHLAPAFGFAHSFDRYQSTTDFGGLQETVPLAMEAMDRLADGDEPWLLFVHGYDCHTPYPKPGPFYRLEQPGYSGPVLEAARQPLTWERIWGDRWYPDFSPQIVRASDQHSFLPVEVFDQLAAHAATPGVRSQALSEQDLSFLLGTYDVAVRQADHHLGRLLDHLEELDLEEDTVVAVFSDHGEDLLAHQTFNHRVGTYDENLQVVLVLRVPGEAPRDEAAPVALLDLSATLARLAGLQWGGRGRDLLGPADPARAIYSESLRGEASIRSAEGRLNLPAAAASSWPPPEDPRSWLRDGEGKVLPLSDPRASRLHQALLKERPPW